MNSSEEGGVAGPSYSGRHNHPANRNILKYPNGRTSLWNWEDPFNRRRCNKKLKTSQLMIQENDYMLRVVVVVVDPKTCRTEITDR